MAAAATGGRSEEPVALRRRGTHPGVRRPRRGLPGQLPERTREQAARQGAVQALAALQAQGGTIRELAPVVGFAERTLRRWDALVRQGTLLPVALGRRPVRGTAAARNAVIGYLREAGPRVGRPTLQGLFPGLSRRELEELSRRHRRTTTRRQRDVMEALEWREPGTVWAIDFSDAGLLVDQRYRYLLLVRDLASGYELLALPCEREDAAVVGAALEHLFAAEGAPLVLKSDNGGGFVAGAVQDLLDEHGVLLLRSPPYTPWYNGAREAGGGWLKTWAFHLAARRGRADAWTSDDVENARLQGNEAQRACAGAATAGERWRARKPIGALQRDLLGAEVERRRGEALARQGDAPLTSLEQAEVDRQVIGGALRWAGLLSSHEVDVPARRSPRRRREQRTTSREVQTV